MKATSLLTRLVAAAMAAVLPIQLMAGAAADAPAGETVEVDLTKAVGPLDHIWANAGSDRAAITLREQWRKDLSRFHEEAGLRYVRFHGSLSYKVSRDLNTYFSYGRSFRQGGKGTNTNGPQYDKYFSYADETSDGYELGAKGSLFDRKLQFNLAAFYQKFDGYQALSSQIAARTDLTGQTLKGTLGFVTNSPAVVKGLELNVSYSFPHRIDLNVGVSYSHAVWADGVVRPVSTKDANGQYVFNTPGEYINYGNVGGQRIGYAPELTISPRLEWKTTVGSKEFFARAMMKYQSNRVLVTNVKQETVGGYAVCDLQAGLRSGNGSWEVSVWGKNVLGRDAIDYFEDPQATFIWTSGFRQVVTTNPTEVGLTVSRRF